MSVFTNPNATCPSCGELLDGATSADGMARTPKAGDLSICWTCGTALEFNGDLTLKQFHNLSELPDETRSTLERMQHMIQGRIKS